MQLKRKILWSARVLALLIILAFVYYQFVLDWNGRPFCHKQIMFGFLNVMHESGGDILHDPKPYPNVNGLSRDSLATIRDSMGGYMDWAKDYN